MLGFFLDRFGHLFTLEKQFNDEGTIFTTALAWNQVKEI